MKVVPNCTQKYLKIFWICLHILALLSVSNATGNSSSQNHFLNPVTLQFTDIEITELLQVMAKLGDTNFLLSESIKGKISIDLKNTPWQTALHSILASRGLRLVRNGEIYWIGPHAEILAFQKYRREDAALPFGGDHINSPKQILIEARIVEADERFARELGVKLGYQANGIGDNPEQKLIGNMDLGGAGLSGFNPASMAATLVSKNASRILQTELSALESEGQGKILSNPRIMTGDQVKATIEQGTELPYQTSNQNGSKLQFRKANLRLEVLPKIHPDGKISMLVGINKDTVGMKTEQGYAIDTKSLSSEVTVENGGTAIIGGIFQTTEREDEVKIPLLGDIPLIGHFFRHKSKLQDKTELLVFLTPTVLDKP
jgi:type IV pilus assembly protein PilQ